MVTLVQKKQNISSKKNLVKKAVKMALDDIKASHTGLFLSSNVVKIRGYVPDLSRSIASLIMSSEDLAFQGECATLLNLSPTEAGEDDKLESCIREKIMGILEVNDKKRKGTTEDAPLLFECEGLDDEDHTDEEQDIVDDSYMAYIGER